MPKQRCEDDMDCDRDQMCRDYSGDGIKRCEDKPPVSVVRGGGGFWRGYGRSIANKKNIYNMRRARARGYGVRPTIGMSPTRGSRGGSRGRLRGGRQPINKPLVVQQLLSRGLPLEGAEALANKLSIWWNQGGYRGVPQAHQGRNFSGGGRAMQGASRSLRTKYARGWTTPHTIQYASNSLRPLTRGKSIEAVIRSSSDISSFLNRARRMGYSGSDSEIRRVVSQYVSALRRGQSVRPTTIDNPEGRFVFSVTCCPPMIVIKYVFSPVDPTCGYPPSNAKCWICRLFGGGLDVGGGVEVEVNVQPDIDVWTQTIDWGGGSYTCGVTFTF